MDIAQILKRDGTFQPFRLVKIVNAIERAMGAVNHGNREDAQNIANKVMLILEDIRKKDTKYTPSIEGIQNLVEETLMASDFPKVARAYILYRAKHARERVLNIFEKRINLKPYEYPELLEYVDAIRHSYWIHTEFNFSSDVQDFKAGITDSERNALKNSMLAISQIEVAVKTFWGRIHERLPKPEIGSVGATFAESEVRHHDAYSHLLELLGLNEEFEKLKENPVIMQRIDYLESALKYSTSSDNKEYSEAILLFALFIEHISLFSQFLIIMAFNKYQNKFKGISNAVEATSKEEQIHGDFGIEIINIIKKENPEWFDGKHNEMVRAVSEQAYKSEVRVIDWIFEEGELDFLPKNVVKEFIKNRFNKSLESIGIEKIFEIDEELLKKSEWFDDEIIGTKHGDFFVKRSINYNKRSKSVTSEDLF